MLLPEQMPGLIEHGLQVSCDAIAQHLPPVDTLIVREPALRAGELAQQRDRRRSVEHAPECFGEVNCVRLSLGVTDETRPQHPRCEHCRRAESDICQELRKIIRSASKFCWVEFEQVVQIVGQNLVIRFRQGVIRDPVFDEASEPLIK